ncbi:MAG: GDSL-type esterase/lipase family protein [Croceivirga sp.]
MKPLFLFLAFFLLVISRTYAQEPVPFTKEVAEIVERNDSIWDKSMETIVFTGSSSIRFWKDIQERFPEKLILNAGCGGSQASDLSHHLNDLVLRYKPTKVFIYEGDNDVFAKKKPKTVLHTFEDIVSRLLSDDSSRTIVLISTKPSLSRWKLRRKYRRLNKKLKELAIQLPKVDFVDVWQPMLNGKKVKPDLFIEDGLHMNSKGYDIWYEALKSYVE